MQFGGSTIDPEPRLIDRSKYWDLATFDLPEVFITPAGGYIHTPTTWTTPRIEKADLVLYGGYPGGLRNPGQTKADFPFETFATRVTSASHDNISLQLEFPHIFWPGHEGEEINIDLGGQSGGPVYRVIEGIVDRLEIGGFIYEFNAPLGLQFARHADFIDADGFIRPRPFG